MRIRGLVKALDEAFTGPAWHGPTLEGALRGVTADEAAWRPGAGRHCIWEYAVHAAYWKYVVRRRITGAKRGGFERKGSDFFPLPEPADEAAWRADQALLRAAHGRLVEAVGRLKAADLERKAGRGRWTVGAMIRGAGLHDTYHAGQIQLLKRLRQSAG